MPGVSGLPLAGVEAIVEGLSGFQSDVRQMNSALDSIQPRSTLLQRGFETLTSGIVNFGKGLLQWGVEGLTSFGASILRVAEHALGQLLADAINFAITKIKELISATIEAGNEFQTLEIRLDRLNFNSLIESGVDYNVAQEKALQLTKDQLEWLQKLAATSPYDNTDVSDTYTLARSYGFLDEEARKLTEDILDFVSGMGLTEVEIKRIMKNFGQMRGLGKVMQRDLNDLATGGFVPVNDILKRVSENTGVAMEDMEDFRKTAESVPAFMQAFSEVVEERFGGATEKMAKTFKAASDNARDVVKSIGGLQVVKPILDVLGDKIAKFVSAFTDNPERWDRMVGAAARLGKAVSGVVAGILNLLPGADSLAETVINMIGKAADWVETHGPDIINFFRYDVANAVGKAGEFIQGIFTTAKTAAMEFMNSGFSVDFLETLGFKPETAQNIIDFVDGIKKAWDDLKVWVEDNGPLIKEFFGTVWEIISRFLEDVTSRPGKEAGGGGNVLDSITKFMQFVIDNKEEILKWVEILWSVFVVWQVLATIWNIVIGVVISLAGVILTLVTVFASLKIFLGLVLVAFSALLVPIALVGSAVLLGMAYWEMFKRTMVAVKAGIDGLVVGFQVGWAKIKEATEINIEAAAAAIRNKDWVGLGMAIIGGLAQGILLWIGTLANAMLTALVFMVDAARNYLGIHSPSTLFQSFGQSLMEGLGQGILSGVGILEGSIGHITSVVSEKFNHLVSVAEEKMNHINSILGGVGIDFGNLGIGAGTAWAYGINQSISAGEKAGRDMAEQTTRATRQKLKARSPSLVFEELGMFTMEGFAQGIEKAAGLAVGAMQGAMSAVMSPAFSSMAAAGGTSITNNRTANLTINSSAPIEPVVQDFNMLESLMGA